eukprot:GFUD01010814.1.p1 GENE.GFUD01010814.1~~GFUD01010814.1.p1  ORF type:complete len:416 (-),score=136.29 GFUD01010814.1:202-1449(-)
MKCSLLVLLLLCAGLGVSAVDVEQRELFSWTSGLKRGGGRRAGAGEGGNSQNRRQVPSVSGLDTAEEDQNVASTGIKTGYGYTRGSEEYVGRSRSRGRPAGVARREEAGQTQTGRERTRPSMSLASALSLLEKNSVGLTVGQGQDRRERNLVESRATPVQTVRKRNRPGLRQSLRGRKVAAIPGANTQIPVDSGIKSQQPGGSNAPGPTGYGYTRGSQEFVESRGRQAKVVRGRPAGGQSQSAELRQGVSRQVAPIPPVYEEEYEDYGEVYQDYGEYGEYGYPEVGLSAGDQGGEGGGDQTNGRGGGEEDDRTGQEEEEDQVQGGGEETGGGETDDGQCGPECRNLLHELEHPKEHERCPNAGMVIDIWGYCRYIFHEERRDWRWWENLRTFVQGQGNSWYNSYRPTAYEEQHMG